MNKPLKVTTAYLIIIKVTNSLTEKDDLFIEKKKNVGVSDNKKFI